MKAILTLAEYSHNPSLNTYHGQCYWQTSPASGTLKFTCLKDGHTINLEMEGKGLPYFDCNSDYDIEIKIKEIPKTCPKEHIIK